MGNYMWKFGFIVFLLLMADIFTWGGYQLEKQKQKYEKIIQKKDNIIANKDKKIIEYKKDQDDYKNTLESIIVSLYNKENYMGIGGFDNKNKDTNIEQLVKTIENSTINFNKYLDYAENFFKHRNKKLENIPSIFPVPYSSEMRITSGYGYRIYPFTGEIFFHKGIDITGKDITPIIATANGVITDVWIWHRIYGKMVKIKHDNGFTTLYAHMESTKVREGKKVKQGDVIGIMGDTGKSRGVHLHYEIRKDNELVNPIDYLSSNTSLYF